MTKVILFDFDGTIADSFEQFLGIVSVISEKYHLPTLSRRDLENLREVDARTLLKKLKIPLYKIPFLAHDMKKMQHESIESIKPFEGLSPALIELKSRGFVLGIVTSNGIENVSQFLRDNNLDIFEYLYCDTHIFGKDKAIKSFLKKHNLAKDDVVYVGDEMRDIQACKKVGVTIIAVTWGFNSRKGLLKLEPDSVADNPEELVSILSGSPKE